MFFMKRKSLLRAFVIPLFLCLTFIIGMLFVAYNKGMFWLFWNTPIYFKAFFASLMGVLVYKRHEEKVAIKIIFILFIAFLVIHFSWKYVKQPSLLYIKYSPYYHNQKS
jgi:peptidoglycan/LPS O-acetylase OafA/YrhL